ncbi:4-hydroxybenzoate polyprenyltransferase [Cyanobium sp. WAJ14-Wanaka]|uniref:4-hydroxybenzoate polyprenyltransferase n=1 Tax=Cyanobium sp. WAJ14-Wanaka TaxID=2823725 RepID=UPI0020CFB774|nr:4-hydroxybenzoate polyprenyltransferase [Cyanobium sp. WAJ14-Wanaka]MCP9774154.1 4-hydroxybenzoate polyprenyltransferase [Cyanobium sp. WAJ14-Wanaka]
MAVSTFSARLKACLELLRWHKPSGRLILLIPAGWSLWLTPNAPPSAGLMLLIVLGGLAVSGAGCIANDLWDRRIDPLVERTKGRPLADGRLKSSEAAALLVIALALALLVVLLLPSQHRWPCLWLAVASLPPVLLYPSAKRWFPYPQAVLALCWGFAVLIPWAASTGSITSSIASSITGSWVLALTWLAAALWTFGFDTVYAMADRQDDQRLGVRSSALSLGSRAPGAVAACYLLACLGLALAAWLAGVGWPFWPLWLLATGAMQKEAWALRPAELPRSIYGQHFSRQVQLGGLLLLALVVGRA